MADKKKGSGFWPWLLAFGRKHKVSEIKLQDTGASLSQEKNPGSELKLNDEPKNDRVIKVLSIVFGVLNGIMAIVALALIVVSTMSAIVSSGMDTQDTSGRLVSFILLVFTSAIAIAVVVYAVLAIFTHKVRPIFVATIVLIVLALIQAIVAGAGVQVTDADEGHMLQGLTETFQMAKQHSPRHVKMWSSMQNSLRCCGLFTPYDYRSTNSPSYVPPDVPISCCPNYDPDRSDLLQEKEREYCKARNEYYTAGCSVPVLEVITDTSTWVLNITVTLLVLEIISAFFGAAIVQLRKNVATQKDDPGKKDDPEANN